MKPYFIRHGAAAYISKVKSVCGSNLQYYYPCLETAGTAAVNRGKFSPLGDGTYTGVSLATILGPKGGVNPYYDGVNCYMSYLTASFAANFNRELGTVFVWLKAASALWTDGLAHIIVQIERGGNSDCVQLMKATGDNYLYWFYVGNNVVKGISSTSFANTNWQFMAITFSVASDQVIAYMNGVQVGDIATGLTAFRSGDLTGALLAATQPVPTTPWYGYLGHLGIVDRVLTAPELLSLV